MKEWKEYKLGDLIVLSSGGTPNKSNSSFWDGDIPWISAKSMYDDYLYSSDMTITKEGLNNGSKLAPVNSILLLTRGSGLFNRIPVCLVKREMAFNQDVKCIESINEDIVSNLFLFYWLIGNKQEISNILETTGIGAGKIDTERLKNIPINLPPIQKQQVLIKFAESLMLKIEVNRRINDNLEQQAQALFKSWFVDFEPFKDQPFVESELGLIPQGWKVGTFLENINVMPGGTPSTSVESFWKDGVIPFFSPKDVKGVYCFETEKSITEDGLNNCSSHLYPKDTLFITARGTVGKITLAGCPMAMNQSNYALVAKTGIGKYYLYLLTQTLVNVLLKKANGAVFSAISTRDFNEPTIMPPLKELERFEDLAKPIFDKIYQISRESRRLAELRDTLLPHLMSGKININEIN